MKQPIVRHHRKLQCRGGTVEHTIRVPDNLHKAWHLLMRDRNSEQIAAYINNVWLDPDDILICFKRSDWEGTNENPQ